MHLFKKILLCLVAGVGLQLVNSNYHVVNADKTQYEMVNPNKTQVLPIGLKTRNQRRLTKFIYQTITPGNDQYRKYLTPQNFGKNYGLSEQNVKFVDKYLHKHHLKTYTYPGNVLMVVSGKTKDLEKTFNLRLRQSTNRKHNFQIAKMNKTINPAIVHYVTYVDKDSLEFDLPGKNTPPTKPKPNPGIPKGLTARQIIHQAKDPNIKNRSFKKFGINYKTDDLYNNNHYGQGQTIGIISPADFRNRDIQRYWKRYEVKNTVSNIQRMKVDNNISKSSTDSEETTMDVEQASSIAPQARIKVYIGDNTNSSFLLNYAAAIGKDNVSVISSSYGNFESDYKKHSQSFGEIKLLNTLMKQAAAQGISNFNATGDNGAYAFQDGSKKIATGVIADSPYVTAVGGTTLPFKDMPFSSLAGISPLFKIKHNKFLNVKQERTWNNSFYEKEVGTKYLHEIKISYLKFVLSHIKNSKTKQKIKEMIKKQKDNKKTVSASELYNNFGSSGGGFSNIFSLPNYQKNVSGVGTFRTGRFVNIKTGANNFNPKIISGKRGGRNVPDISGNADPLTSYSIWFHNHELLLEGNGTSVVTPQMSAMAAVINSAQNKRMGFWNPQIYRFAKQSDSPFTPLNNADENNLYYSGQPGKLYNQMTGLGTVNFTKLNQKFSDLNN